MQTVDAINTLDKHMACRHAECNLECEGCLYNATFEEITEALQEARKALVKREVEENAEV